MRPRSQGHSKGYKSWAVRYARRSDGKIRRLTLGDIRLISLAEARKRTKEAMIEVIEGRDPQGDKQRESKVEAFNELADRYLTRYAKRKKRTWKRDQELLDRDIRPTSGAMRVSTIERHHITEILDNVEDRGVTTQVNRVHEIVRGVFHWGLERGTIKNDPTFGIKARIKANTRTRVLKGDELALI